METMELTLVLPCAMGCGYCPQDNLSKNYSGCLSFDFKDLITCLDKVPKHIRLDLSGFSESLLYNDFSKLIAYFKETSRNYVMYTTLFGLDDDKLEALTLYHPSHLCYHVPDIQMKSKVSPNYIQYVQKAFDKLRFNEVVNFNTIQPELQNIVNSLSIPAHSRAGNLGDTNKKSGSISCSKVKGNYISGNVLLPNGDLVLCCMDFSLSNKLGNLLTNSYDEILNSQTHQKVLQQMKEQNNDLLCRYCVESRHI